MAEQIAERSTTHGLTKSAEYRVWASMIQRCHNKNEDKFKDYGGRGITVCDEWRTSFETFLADMGKRPSDKHEIDRKKNNEGYCKENCHWVTGKQNCRNKRNNHLLTFNGETMTLTDWAERIGVSFSVLKSRIKRGWTTEETLQPLTRRSPKAS